MLTKMSDRVVMRPSCVQRAVWVSKREGVSKRDASAFRSRARIGRWAAWGPK